MKTSALLLLFPLFIVSSISLRAQEFKTEHVDFNGVKYPAYSKVVNVSEDQAWAAIREIFSSRGVQPKTIKGFLVYRKVVLPATGNRDLHDLFVTVERQGKKNDRISKVYAIITRPDAISDDKPLKEEKGAASGVALAAGGSQFFDAVTPALENQAYLQGVLEQEDVVKKAEKGMNSLLEDSVRLNKQLIKLQEEVKKNSEDRARQALELEAAKSELEIRRNAKPGIKN